MAEVEAFIGLKPLSELFELEMRYECCNSGRKNVKWLRMWRYAGFAHKKLNLAACSDMFTVARRRVSSESSSTSKTRR
jgi:hypothetical protein